MLYSRPNNKLKYAVILIGILCLIITTIAIYYFERQRYEHNESRQKQTFINKKTVYTGNTAYLLPICFKTADFYF